MRVLSLLSFLTLTAFALAGDEDKSIEELITQQGFTFEEFSVKTQDGYICKLHHLHAPQGPTKGPVFLQHGLLDSSDAWVVNYRDRSLGFILADEGFDVFLGNSRGNKYCLEHESLDSKQSEFWDFSWDEMAKRDIPAYVDAILSKTSQESLLFVGHSQGTTQMFAALVSQPELTKKVNLFVAFAPVAYVAHTESPLIKSAAKLRVDELVASLGVQQLLPTSEFMRSVVPWFCTSTLFSWMCDSALHFMIGYNTDEMQQDRMSVFLSHFPSGTSTKDLVHWAQSVRNYEGGDDRSDFGFFDYGAEENMKRYGSSDAPLYDLTKFPPTTDLMIFSGGVDKVADPVDVNRLVADLPSRPFWQVMESYDHLDFMWGQNAFKDVFAQVVERMNQKWTEKSTSSPASGLVAGSFGGFAPLALVCFATVATASVSAFGIVVYRRKQIHKVQTVRKADLDQTLLV
jgi:pimeloyl-ACP methyl ester carboxylesterase